MGLTTGSSFLWGKRYIKEGYGKGHLSPQVALLGEPGGGLFAKDFERQVTIWRAPSLWSLRETHKEALETGITLHKGLGGEHGGGAPLRRTLRER